MEFYHINMIPKYDHDIFVQTGKQSSFGGTFQVSREELH